MIAVAFVAGGVVGVAAAFGTLVFTDLGWAAAVICYFVAGAALPLVAVVQEILTQTAVRGAKAGITLASKAGSAP